MSGLREIQKTYPVIGDVRGLGLYIGVELVSNPEARIPDVDLAKRVVEEMKTNGVLVNINGYDNNIIKIKPPLIIDESGVDRIVSTLDSVLSKISGQKAAA